MSEMTDIIAGSLEGVDRGDDQPVVDESLPEEVVEEPVAEPQAGEEDEEAEITKIAQELITKNPNLKGHIDVSRHQAVLTRNRNKWENERKELSSKYERVKWAEEKEAQAAFQALALAETDQRKFAELLLKDPRFAEIIALKEAQQEQKQEPQRPTPNATTPDGQLQYYDDKGLEELLSWHGSQVEQRIQQALEKRFGPIESEFKQRSLWNKSVNEQRQRINQAREKWPGFKDHEQKIKEFLNQPGNEQLDLQDAYREVVVKSFQDQTKINETELRKKILAELNGKKALADDTRARPREAVVDADENGNARVSVRDIVKANLPRE